MVHQLYQHDLELINEIQSYTDVSVLDGHQIDKQKLAEIFFNDADFKQKVEKLVHQKVYDRIFEFENQDVMFIEIPLLFETNMEDYFDEILFVTTNKKQQLNRVVENRNMTQQQLQQRLDAQLSVAYKMSQSDVILTNDSTLDSLYQQIDNYLKRRNYDTR